VSLVCVDEHQMLKDIEKLIKQTLPRQVIAGFEPDPTAKPQPIQLRSGAPGHGNRGGRPGGGRPGGGGKPRVAGATPAPAGQRSSAPAGGAARNGGQPGNRNGANAGGGRGNGGGNGGGGRSGQGRGPRPAGARGGDR
jgi:ATP-dependent RNA helicase RhlE